MTIVEERQEYDRNGDKGDRVITRNFRGQLVKEARGILSDIAEELGERSLKDTCNGGTFVLIRERIIEHGGSLELLG